MSEETPVFPWLSELAEKALCHGAVDDCGWVSRNWKQGLWILDLDGYNDRDYAGDVIGLLIDRSEEQQAEIERLRALLPDPRELSGWDDDECPEEVARHLIALAEYRGIVVPGYLRVAAGGGRG